VFRRLFLLYTALLVAALAMLAFLVGSAARDRHLRDVSDRIDAKTEMMKEIVRVVPPAELQATVERLGWSTGARLTVFAADGRVLADSTGATADARPEPGRSVTGGIVSSAAAVDGMVVRTSLPLGGELPHVYGVIAVAFLVALAIGAAGTYALARSMTRPLERIRDAARLIADGNLAARVDAGLPAEFGGVADAVNRMTRELEARMEATRAESAKLDAVVSSMDDALVAVDPEGRIRHHNAAALRMFNVASDPRGLKLWEVVRVPGLRENVEEVLQTGTATRTQFEVGARALSAVISRISTSGGAVLVAEDATEQLRYDQLRREFVANVSHELRTPLALIQGFVETLKDGALKDEARAMEFVETIDRHARRLGAIVADLLELSRLESSGQIAKPRLVDVAALLGGVREQFQPLAEKKKQTLTIAAPAYAFDFEADPDLVERALDNLVGNAIKYTPDGGRVTLTTTPAEAEVVFTVEDTGIGIPEKDLARIFERFYRVDKSRSRDLGGTGLGLAIVKHIAQLHAGSVSVASTAGRGTTFTLRLPRRFRGA
jgi:two-component system phosphate regulon sensor histidine kinase PhoR